MNHHNTYLYIKHPKGQVCLWIVLKPALADEH